jgi:hypothetical protein
MFLTGKSFVIFKTWNWNLRKLLSFWIMYGKIFLKPGILFS